MESIIDAQTINSFITTSSTAATSNNVNSGKATRSASHAVSPSSLAAAGHTFFEAPIASSFKVSTD